MKLESVVSVVVLLAVGLLIYSAVKPEDEPKPKATTTMTQPSEEPDAPKEAKEPKERFPKCDPNSLDCIRERAAFRARQDTAQPNRDTYIVAYMTCSVGSLKEIAHDYKVRPNLYAVARAVGKTYVDALEVIGEMACLQALEDA